METNIKSAPDWRVKLQEDAPRGRPEGWRRYFIREYAGDGSSRVVAADMKKADADFLAAAPDMFRALNSLAVNLRALGFAADEEISGADTVDAVAEAFPDIEAALAKAGGHAVAASESAAHQQDGAALDLLAALKGLMSYVGGWDEKDPEHPIFKAIAAIEKAEGGQ